MRTDRRHNDFLVGATVLLAAALLIATILWVKQSGVGSKTRNIVARSRDVGGVAVGNPVVIRGVRSGQVELIALGERGWVVLTLAIERAVSLPADPVVIIVASSLFGEWQVTVADASGVPADRALRAALVEAHTAGDTLAGAVLPDIAQLTSVATRIAGDVAKVSDRMEVAFDDAAAKELRETLRNFSLLSAELARTVRVQSKNLDVISMDVRQGLKTVSTASANLNRFSSRADSATSRGELQAIVANAQTAAKELVTTATHLRDVAAGLSKTEAQLQRVVSRADSVFIKVNSGQGPLGQLVNDPRLYQHGDSLVNELRALVDDIKKNPKRYFNLRVF